MLGLVVATTWSTEAIRTMKPGDTIAIAAHTLTYNGFATVHAHGLSARSCNFGRLAARRRYAEPSRRRFPARSRVDQQADILTIGFSQLYISLGDIAVNGAATVRIYCKPLVALIWLGAIIMALGGALSLSDRRLRVGAPRPARRRRPVDAGGVKARRWFRQAPWPQPGD